ncbi:dynamin-1 [Dendryphion nanum]|uniref:Dynamin-1 n=1 Tax=Dendryphion nanum TaxID=256645 RepID=A0A9P9DQP8_9PLEO|nr:dynamin-1 [Dendryphion nanum]
MAEEFLSPIDTHSEASLPFSSADAPETDSLEQLQSEEQIQLLDAIDTLKSQGVNEFVSLPQLIVCGEQSSGKSSVLEGLTRLRFPTKDTLCTTFATEVNLRSNPNFNITCTIRPVTTRQPTEIRKLQRFKKVYQTLHDFSFPVLVDEARECMATAGSVRKSFDQFFHDTLRIEYSGPELPRLTVVDLPGLTQSDLGDNKNAPKQVEDLVLGYMAEPQSIALVIVSAQNDLENQSILNHARTKLGGQRVLGIVTKPDKLDVGSGKEKKIIDLMTNKTGLHPEYGWHAVKNRDYTTSHWSNTERDDAEQQFFSTGVWKAFSRCDLGIDTLRTKLSKILLQQIQKELPNLIASVHTQLSETKKQLKLLGESREKPSEQRRFLTEKAERFQSLTNCALKGIYSDRFFALSSEDGRVATRLRTEVQNLNIAFASTMYRKGHSMAIIDEDTTARPNTLTSNLAQEYDVEFDEPQQVTKAELLQNFIGAHVRQSRPAGLPSLVNPWVIGEVFQKQSIAWEEIAAFHLDKVFEAIENYIEVSLTSFLDHQTTSKLKLEHISVEMEERKRLLDDKLQELLVPYKEYDPMTYDPQFINEIREIRDRRKATGLFNHTNQPKSIFGTPAPTSGNIGSQQLLTESLDDFTNSEILDLMQTYYKSAISVFINNVAILGVESCLMSNLTSIFSPSLVSSMSDEQLNLIASESSEIVSNRALLNRKLNALTKGKALLRSHVLTAPQVSIFTQSTPQTRSIPRSRSQQPVVERPTRSEDSRSRTPTPQRSDTIDDISSSFDQLSVTPPEEKKTRQSPSTARKMARMRTGRGERFAFRTSSVEDSEEELSAFGMINGYEQPISVA